MKVNQLKIGTILSYAQMLLSVIIGLIQSPLVIRALGQSEYGLYNTIVSTLSMLSILSLGFNSSYIRYYAKYKKENRHEDIYRLNGLFLLIFSIIGCIALSCGLFLTFNLHLIFDKGLTTAEYEIAKVLTLILTINLAFTFPMSVFQNIISAHEKFVFLKSIGIIRTVFSPLLIISVLLLGYKSVALAILTVSINFIVDIIYLIYVFVVLKNKFYFRNFEKGLFKSLFGFTIFIAINLIVDEINSNMDKLLLGRYSGTASVAIYSVGYTLYNYYRQFSTSIYGVFTPKIHKIYNANKDNLQCLKAELSSLFIKVGRIQFIILALIATGLLFFGKPFIHFWAGEGYEESYYVALLLIFPASIALIQNVGMEIQRAENKHQFRSIAYLIMAIINLILTIHLCQLYGAIGAAMGTALSFILANGIIMNIYYHKVCYINIILFWKNIVRLCVGLIIPIGMGIIVTTFIDLYILPNLILFIIIYTLIYGISMWFLGMNNYERNLVKKPVQKLFMRK